MLASDAACQGQGVQVTLGGTLTEDCTGLTALRHPYRSLAKGLRAHTATHKMILQSALTSAGRLCCLRESPSPPTGVQS
jgi:hypothetical protein